MIIFNPFFISFIPLNLHKILNLKVFYSINDFTSSKRTILTLGTFDGVHIGHKKILEKIIQKEKDCNSESLVLTFFPHPRMVLENNSDVKLLNTLSERTSLLKNIGIENLVIHPFDEKFSQLSAVDFVKEILVNQFQIQKIVIGHDHRFGKDRSANIDDLIAFGKQFNFEVEQISVQEIEAVSISSTKIRKALQIGNIELANSFLGYNYSLSGMVVKGKQLGRTIGFPTANLKIQEEYKLIPCKGVYVVQSEFNQKRVYGIMNIGLNPTFEGTDLSIEIHYFDFNEDLYGQEIIVSLLKFIRPEQKFDSINHLQQQLSKDKEWALNFLKNL